VGGNLFQGLGSVKRQGEPKGAASGGEEPGRILFTKVSHKRNAGRGSPCGTEGENWWGGLCHEITPSGLTGKGKVKSLESTYREVGKDIHRLY